MNTNNVNANDTLYTNLLDAGVEPGAAYEGAFGFDIETLDRDFSDLGVTEALIASEVIESGWEV